MVSRPESGSDPPIGSDRETGCDNTSKKGLTRTSSKDLGITLVVQLSRIYIGLVSIDQAGQPHF